MMHTEPSNNTFFKNSDRFLLLSIDNYGDTLYCRVRSRITERQMFKKSAKPSVKTVSKWTANGNYSLDIRNDKSMVNKWQFKSVMLTHANNRRHEHDPHRNCQKLEKGTRKRLVKKSVNF